MTALPPAIVHAARALRSRSVLVVLVELHESLDDVEFRKAPVAAIGRRLAMADGYVYRVVRRLVEMGYLEVGDRLGNAMTYRLRVPPNAQASERHAA